MFNKKVLVLVCGGVITMKPSVDDSPVLDSRIEDNDVAKDIMNHVPGIDHIASMDVEVVSQGFSHNVTLDKWNKIINIIEEKYNEYDGFVITTGADTMGYLSSALSFVIQNLGKPIILTGARNSIYEIKTDAKINLINSLCVAITNLSGVFVVFGSKIILGTRATRTSRISLDSFSSFNKDDFAVTNNIFSSLSSKRNDDRYVRHDIAPDFKKGFDDSVLCLSLTPDMDIEFLKELSDDRLKAVIFMVLGTGILPNNFVNTLENLRRREIPVIVASACKEGTTSYTEYKILEQKNMNLNIIEAFDMSPECVCSKCMWMLGQNVSYKDFKFIFQQNISGEIDREMCNSILEEKHYISL
ncbi:MAG: asparaginase domain-containing protein [Alphaproteobacteria bacterium]|nr:asparaginase domain-containing protein [Alphaproteobacteria bacterium]